MSKKEKFPEEAQARELTVVELHYRYNVSFKDIGEEFGISRSAVAGILSRWRRRYGVVATPRDAPRKPEKVLVKRRRRAVKIIRRQLDDSLLTTNPTVPIPYETFELLDLKHNQCRWPYGSDNFKFCGRKKYLLFPYCYDHCIASKPK